MGSKFLTYWKILDVCVSVFQNSGSDVITSETLLAYLYTTYVVLVFFLVIIIVKKEAVDNYLRYFVLQNVRLFKITLDLLNKVVMVVIYVLYKSTKNIKNSSKMIMGVFTKFKEFQSKLYDLVEFDPEEFFK